MASINASVGQGGVNRPEDVKIIQQLLNQKSRPAPGLDEDGKIGPKTLAAIQAFQADIVEMKNPDGRIDPGGKTLAALNEEGDDDVSRPSPTPPPDSDYPFSQPLNPVRGLTGADYESAAEKLGVDTATIKTVAEVETAGNAFDDQGRPRILFERHYFHRLTGGKFDAVAPDISNKAAGGYGKFSAQYGKLERAYHLNADAALRSASWGRFQIMGDNFQAAGFASARAFVMAVSQSEAAHLQAFVSFVSANKSMAAALRAKDWTAFAKAYNGPGYKENNYDTKLKNAYERISRG